jgi:hypothetical protein
MLLFYCINLIKLEKFWHFKIWIEWSSIVQSDLEQYFFVVRVAFFETKIFSFGSIPPLNFYSSKSHLFLQHGRQRTITTHPIYTQFDNLNIPLDSWSICNHRHMHKISKMYRNMGWTAHNSDPYESRPFGLSVCPPLSFLSSQSICSFNSATRGEGLLVSNRLRIIFPLQHSFL